MSEAYKSISKGLKEAIEYSKGNTKGYEQIGSSLTNSISKTIL